MPRLDALTIARAHRQARGDPDHVQGAPATGRCSEVLSAAKREWERPDADSWRVPVIGAVVSLGGILLSAALLRSAVDFAYDDSSGCRYLTATSAAALAWVMAPVRVLLVAWVIASALGLAGKLAADAPERLTDTRKYAVVGAVFLALALMLFVGADVLSAIVPLVLLVPLTLTVVVLLCLRAPVSRGRWLWLSVIWLLGTGIVLPVVLVILTRSGEVASC